MPIDAASFSVVPQMIGVRGKIARSPVEVVEVSF
jgi:hypothetical protein